jgi:hypothetical protein
MCDSVAQLRPVYAVNDIVTQASLFEDSLSVSLKVHDVPLHRVFSFAEDQLQMPVVILSGDEPV